jgi:uncharacterized SAM-binding protein YcdF (DUF218 family)
MVTIALLALAGSLAGVLLRRRATYARGAKVAGWLAVLVLLGVAATVAPSAYDLRKLISYCLMPAGLLWLGLLALTVTLWRRRQRRFAAAALVLWLGYTAAGNAWLGSYMLGLLQRGYESALPPAGGPFDAVLVLGGGIEIRSGGQARLAEGGDRLLVAVRLFRAGQARLLLTSGPVEPLAGGREASDPAATAAIWEGLGVPSGSIVQVVGPRTTTDEVLALKRLVAERGWRRVGLITSAFHLPRALRLCRRYGVEVTPLSADVHGSEEPAPRYLVPQWLGFCKVQLACWELLGMLAGR